MAHRSRLVIAGRTRDVVHSVPTTGTTITLTKGCPRLDLKPAGTIAALNVVLPFSPVDGDLFTLTTTQQITTLTVTAPGGATVSNGTGTATPNSAMDWRYNLGDTTWYSA